MEKNYVITLVVYLSLDRVDEITHYGEWGWELHQLDPDYLLLRRSIKFKGYQGTLEKYVEIMNSLVESITEAETGEIIYSHEEGWLHK